MFLCNHHFIQEIMLLGGICLDHRSSRSALLGLQLASNDVGLSLRYSICSSSRLWQEKFHLVEVQECAKGVSGSEIVSLVLLGSSEARRGHHLHELLLDWMHI